MRFVDFNGVGEATIKALAKYNIHDPNDLLTIFPKDYKDTRVITPINHLVAGKRSLIQGRVTNLTYKKFGKKFLRFNINDNTGFCSVILFKFYPNQLAILEKSEYVRCYGKVEFSLSPQMVHPEWATVNNGECALKQGFSAVYRLKKIPDRLISKMILKMLQDNRVENIIPSQLLRRFNLISFCDALYYVHALTNFIDEKYLSIARFSIKFEEMLAYKLAEQNIYKNTVKAQAPQLFLTKIQQNEFYEKLPYQLTNAQQRAITEILDDIKKSNAMNRLLQGDVGAGKTIVATIAAYAAVKSGYQVAMMAPTEILAEQHFSFLSQYLASFDIKVIPLLGKLSAKQTRESLDRIKDQKDCVVVGTHAIFQERVEYCNLGLVIVDEQHRFGVEQRLALVSKSSSNFSDLTPHQLIISATPIPRTLAMTLYGNLKLSILDELPPKRKPIITTVLNRAKKQNLIEKVKQAVLRGEQVYWVCPLVEESENMDFLQDVKTLYQELLEALGKENVGLVYGSMKSKDKIEQMAAFKAKKYAVLVATTVIEVGVDVPNATIMIIDNAERLGISQLHQLRGRVGRGAKESYCILLYSDKISEVGKRRLSLVRESQDGFYLAEKDLEIRGAGDIIGKEQSGVSTFKTFDINEYYDNYDKVVEFADMLDKHYPELVDKLIQRWFDRRVNYVEV
ncbi:ATP-dependent DNA helicase RecG [Francisella tularensis]|uniref:ATP-dependent DNA helicase RecG n=3 Tax=Francisella tularensis TaxID=263 RepID=Q5NEM5_FRATT|nr:ATP-dependent DNA helicase RecG [Francisella tularensis]ADA79249.1 ATP-dependent DNA helicase RecG [Francisella tularensis subsp. tularensis NE061598]AFB79604.1 ATP-dependent DNA helicase RecG [Francisella tularensis subsp. tularensis TIGB03]AFB81148.1 ATP-dependent DNA helicase RecG [Francisella tularensis subsp. tularensis TI0902]AJI68779.1 type III restriction enzyme, res subunit [Francisella tularensis subsp. tularensis SCHU S4]AJI70323.1 type III restriction enzyme, res subunit [Franci